MKNVFQVKDSLIRVIPTYISQRAIFSNSGILSSHADWSHARQAKRSFETSRTSTKCKIPLRPVSLISMPPEHLISEPMSLLQVKDKVTDIVSSPGQFNNHKNTLRINTTIDRVYQHICTKQVLKALEARSIIFYLSVRCCDIWFSGPLELKIPPGCDAVSFATNVINFFL